MQFVVMDYTTQIHFKMNTVKKSETLLHGLPNILQFFKVFMGQIM